MDHVDKIQDRLDQEQIEIIKRARMDVGISLPACEDCGNEIMEKRRQALPGVRTCLACAVHRELKNRKED